MKKSTSSFAGLTGKLLLFMLLLCGGLLNAQGPTVLIPYQGTTSIPCGQNSVIQPHNANVGTYNNNADGYVVIDCGFNAAISLVATYTTEASFDFIRIYNGVGTGGTLLQSYSGQNGTFTYNATPGQTITVRFQSDGSVVYQGFNINVTFSGPCFATPCAGMPVTNTITGNPISICPAANSTLALAYSYSVGGIQYQWVSSTVSPVGPFNPVPNATVNALVTPTLPVTTWFAAVVTCTNSLQSSTTTGQQILVQGLTTNGIPYYEDFEGITLNNMLPNCSWSVSSVVGAKTYTGANNNNRVPRSGSKFASFSNAPPGTFYYYTNGIQLQPGITYSAGLWFTTEYFGYNNWTNLSLLYGSNQATTGLSQITQVSPAVSGPYKALGGLFSVGNPGLYYVAVRATGASGSAPYLSWDDLSVTIPCTANSGNTPTLTLGISNQTICAGDQIVLNASGADVYTWNGQPGGSSYPDTPTASGIYTLAGTNTLTGCVSTMTIDVTVNPTPNVFIIASQASVCPGETAFLTAFGAPNYMWSNNAQGNPIQVNPLNTTTFAAVGTSTNGCSSAGVFTLSVKQSPTISVASGSGPDICKGDNLTLIANGAVSYSWLNSTTPVLMNGSPLTVTLSTSTSFTVTGTGANGCSNKTTFSQNVNECTSITENSADGGLTVYPNPTSGLFNIELKSGLITSVVITDISGRVVSTTAASDNSIVLNVSELAAGVYYARVNSENGSSVVRVIKN